MIVNKYLCPNSSNNSSKNPIKYGVTNKNKLKTSNNYNNVYKPTNHT